jgi:hypothetical protein
MTRGTTTALSIAIALLGAACSSPSATEIGSSPALASPGSSSSALHRIHECVFGVLALESEPVDPRL